LGVLLDLLHFNPARIKIFNNNLYLAKDWYHKERSGSREVQNRELRWFAIALHNIISNYEIAKSCYDAGCFEADEEFTEVLSLGTREYLRRMETLEK